MIALAARQESRINDGQLARGQPRMMSAVTRKYAVLRLPLNDFRGNKRDVRNVDRNDRQTHRVFIAARHLERRLDHQYGGCGGRAWT